jgi:hypothetical protein
MPPFFADPEVLEISKKFKFEKASWSEGFLFG